MTEQKPQDAPLWTTKGGLQVSGHFSLYVLAGLSIAKPLFLLYNSRHYVN